ncbi:MAG TPA: aminotransferase class III-fold pyridoxal phosphate-dependent enzyme [Gaiellaceae bacterium]
MVELAARPVVTCEEAERLARELFGMTASAIELPSERDRNFRLDVDGGPRYVLKIARREDTRELLEAQEAAARHVLAKGVTFAVPEPAGPIEEVELREGARFVRLLSWVPGEPLTGFAKDDAGVAASVGDALGQLAAALADFDHPALVRELQWDPVTLADVAVANLGDVSDEGRRKLLARHLVRNRLGWRALRRLRQGIVHNDANDHNVLVGDGRVVGIVDFGDLIRGPVVAELAVGAAYTMLGAADPLGVAEEVSTAFRARHSLEGPELKQLYSLVLARLCASAALAGRQRWVEPTNEYLSISEEPVWELLERLDHVDPGRARLRLAGASLPARDLLARRRRVLSPSLSLSYAEPLEIVRGRGAYLYDEWGRRYLDCVNNVAHVGHCHPRVTAAAEHQQRVLNTNTRYLHETILDYAERLAATLPAPLEVVYLVNSGSEANELALRLARAATGRRDVAVLSVAYHGNSNALVEISPYKFEGPGGFPRPAHVHVAPLPDVYRGESVEASWYVDRLRDTLNNREIAAFFAESLPSAAGQIVPPPGYLRGAYAAARAAGAVVVADEVQTGLGRVGSAFWAFELDGAVPDVVSIGKPIGNGHPLGAVVTTRAIAEAFANGMEWFSTFGGNPVSCAVGLAVLDVIRDERLQARALATGATLVEGLGALAARHELIGDVRGAGLFMGVELVRDREAKAPATDEAAAVVERARERGVLLSTDGPFHNVLKVKPPLVFAEAEAELLVSTLDVALGEVRG